jgi:LacI family transcriptional regulator
LGILEWSASEDLPVRTRIALLVESSTSWGAGIIAGVGHYATAAGLDWDMWHEPRGRNERLELPEGWRPDGIIARVTHAELARSVSEARIPTVDVSWYRIDPAISRCSVQEEAAAEASARYLVDLGLRQFAYLGSSRRPGYVDRLGTAFAAWLADRSLPSATFDPAAWADRPGHGPDDGLARWLGSLAKPVGLFTFDSFTARRAAEACHTAGIDVPGDVAVLAGEHDELASQLASPPLSSLDHSPEQVGRRAAPFRASPCARAGRSGQISSCTLGCFEHLDRHGHHALGPRFQLAPQRNRVWHDPLGIEARCSQLGRQEIDIALSGC